MKLPRHLKLGDTGIFWLRAAWVVVQVVAAIWMARSGLQFYYQGF